MSKHYTEQESTFLIENFDDFLKMAQQWSCNPKNGIVLYRGQRFDNPLIPGIARTAVDPQKYNVKHILKFEEDMYNEFLRVCDTNISHRRISQNDTLDVLSLAQHYGLPTRLLDWSSNPLAALFFAIMKVRETEEKEMDGFCYVWASCIEDKEEDDRIIYRPDDPVRAKPFTEIQKSPETMILKPKLISERIHAQAGWFTVNRCLPDKGFVPLEEDKTFNKGLVRMKIPKRIVKDLRRQLDIFHVNNSTLFPDLVGKTKHIRWKFAKDFEDIEDAGEYHSYISEP